MANKNLSAAKRAKNDEFYTRIEDIDNECKHYREHFKGKIILCNCDNLYESAFFKYFALNFKTFELKGLMATCYNGSTIGDNQLSLFPGEEERTTRVAHSIVLLPEDLAEYERVDEDVIKDVIAQKHLVKKLRGNGDYGSEECLEFLKQADIVVTNPPFSKFREFVATLMEYEKKFLIIGNKNAITYKEFFPLLKENKVWIGYTNVKEFVQPDGSIKKFGNIGWFTNLDIKKRHEKLILWKRYTPEEYPKYDNYDAINVDRVAEIPCDYKGIMGVPITFLDKYSPDQFEILGITKTWFGAASKTYNAQVQIDKNGKRLNVTKLNDGAVLKVSELPKGKIYYMVDEKYYIQTYVRILIKIYHKD